MGTLMERTAFDNKCRNKHDKLESQSSNTNYMRKYGDVELKTQVRGA